MPEIPAAHLAISTTEDGSQIVFTAAEASFSVPSGRLSEIIMTLIRTLAHPLVSPHALPSTPLAVGGTAKVTPLPLVSMSVTKVLLVDAVGLFLELEGGLRLYFQFSQEDATRLSQQLQAAVEQARKPDPQSRH